MKQQKTIKEWLNELPEPYRSQAIENTVDCDHTDKTNFYNYEAESPREAIEIGFVWSYTDQGQMYWENFCKTLR